MPPDAAPRKNTKMCTQSCKRKRNCSVQGTKHHGRTAEVLQQALPQLWRHFRCEDATNARITREQFQAWLVEHSELKSRLMPAADSRLWSTLRSLQRRRRFEQPMGIRWIDTSKQGTWSVDNIKGYKHRTLSNSKSLVWWQSYVTNYRLSAQKSSTDIVEIERLVEHKIIKVEVEKRRRGHGARPLAKEMVTVTAHSRCKLAHDKRRQIKVVKRTADLLPALILRPLEPAKLPQWTLIYLHGLGSSALGNYTDRPYYFLDGTAAIKVVIPTAPSRELTCFDGWWTPIRTRTVSTPQQKSRYRLQQFLAWYDYLTNYDGAREDTIDLSSLQAMQRALHGLVRQEAKELGGRFDRVILGGKSQGCCTALDAALRFPRKLGGFVGIVGHILRCTPTDLDGPQASTPLHFFHESDDAVMRWSWVSAGEKRLRDAGYNVQAHHVSDPDGNGHFVDGVEGKWVRTALRAICQVRTA